jgi:hypothetical protein
MNSLGFQFSVQVGYNLPLDMASRTVWYENYSS